MEKFKKMRTKSEIINEINETQNLYNRLALEIGLSFANYSQRKDELIMSEINKKIQIFQKTEAQLRFLENELANTK